MPRPFVGRDPIGNAARPCAAFFMGRSDGRMPVTDEGEAWRCLRATKETV